MHHDSNMESVDFNVYMHSNGPIPRVQVKQGQSVLTSNINATKTSISLEAYKIKGL